MTEKSLEQGLRKRLWVIGLPLQYQQDLTNLVLKWSECSGVEWTIKRLKSLKVELYRMRSGLPSDLSWVRKNRRGQLAGSIGGLLRWGNRSEKNFRKAVQALMCYTIFQYSKPTTSQVKKFTTALCAVPPSIGKDMDRAYSAITHNFGIRTIDRQEDVSLILYRGSPTKRKPSRGLTSVNQDSNIRVDAELLLEQSWGDHLVRQYYGLFEPVFAGLNLSPYGIPFGKGFTWEIDRESVVGGKIAFLQEPGGKLRSVASPFLAYQLALRHFGNAVYALASQLPWDCTHDQSKPVSVLKDHLRRGLTVHSVDLSSATDYFPLEVQLKMMRAVFGNLPDIDLFEIISRSKWKSPVGEIRWNRGQPLGLYPSFAVFTVSHGMLLWYLSGFQWKKKFFVLGDDVVILDDDLYHRYLDTLNAWCCPYSKDKSISSYRMCEFAGKVITCESVTTQYKWREMSNNNFIDITRQLGHRSRILLTRRQQDVFDLVKHVMSPLGLNFSYPGSDRASMENLTRQAQQLAEKRVLDSLVDQAGIVWKNLYGSPYQPSKQLPVEMGVKTQYLLQALATFDEKVRSVMLALLPGSLVSFLRRFDPRLFSTLPGSLGHETDLPPARVQPSTLTTLDRYERMLSIR